MMQWGWGGGAWGWGWSLVMGLVFLAFIAAIVVGIVLVVRGLTGGHSQTPAQWASSAPPTAPLPPAQTVAASSALHLLEERYARGEIDREEFLERKHDLQS
jgi:putative membrane protein